MKRLTLGLSILLLAMILVLPVMGQTDQSVMGAAASDGRLSTFVAAVEAAGLTERFSSGTWTLFPPTNEALARVGITAENVAADYTPEELQNFLLYHAVPKFVSLADAKAMVGDQTMANGQIAGWKWYDDTLYINDVSRVISPNIVAANGNLHVVDTVVQGPWPRPADRERRNNNAAEDVDIATLTIAEYLALDGRFSIVAAMVEYAGLNEMLSSGTWTFFAPSNQALNRFGVNADNMEDLYTPEEMRDFLLYHIYPGHMSIAKAQTMLGDITMANGKLAGTKWYRRNLWVNDFSMVAVKDVHVSNGVIQGVRDVILPPWPRVEEPQQPQNAGVIE